MLMDARLAESADYAVVFFDLHEGLEVDVGHAGGPPADAQQQVEVVLVEPRAADLPQALADGRLIIQLAVIIAEFALHIAAIGLSDGAQARAQQTRAAARGKSRRVADEERAPLQRLKAGNLRLQLGYARVLGGLNLSERRQRDLLLMRRQQLALGQLGEKSEPHQRVPLGYFHL